MDIMTMGIGAPETVGELIWWGFGVVAIMYLNSINKKLDSFDKKIDSERAGREQLSRDFAEHKATCNERHKYDATRS